MTVKIFHITIAILMSCTIQQAYSQYSDSIKYHTAITSSGSVNRTNSNKAYLLNNALFFGIKTKSVALNTTNTWIYGKQNSTLTNNDFSSTAFFNLYKTFPHFYYWGLLNYNTSYSLKVNNQLLSGVGVAYSIIDNKSAYINFSNGLLYDKSNLLANEDYHTFRNSFRIQYRFVINDMITIDGSNFYQNSLSRRHDYIIRSANTFSIRLRKWFSLATTLTYNKMKITQRENLNLTYGLLVDSWF